MTKTNITPRAKYKIKKIHNFICPGCKQQKNSSELEIDHKIPIANGGSDELTNLQPLCIECHRQKTRKEFEKGDYIKSDPMNSLNLNVNDKLSVLKKFLSRNKHYNYNEIYFMVLNHPILSKFNYNSTIIYRLLKDVRPDSDSISSGQVKYRSQRDKILYLMRKTTGLTYDKLSNLLGDYDLEMSHVQIRNVCAKFGDKGMQKAKETIKILEKLLKEVKKDIKVSKTPKNDENTSKLKVTSGEVEINQGI